MFLWHQFSENLRLFPPTKFLEISVQYFKDCNCVFLQSTGTIGTRFLQKVSNALQYIDRHTLTIERESSRKFSDSFKKLLGLNRPEKSTHWKPKISSLSRHKLLKLSMALKEVLQALQFAN